MEGPLISAFNATLTRLSQIDQEIAAVDSRRIDLLNERVALLRDMEQAKLVLAHLGTPYIPEAENEQGKDAKALRAKRRRPIHESSSVGWARRVLRTARRPIHIDEILTLIAQMTGQTVSKATLVSNLSRYVKAGDTFRRTAANTFELIPNEEKGDMRLVG